MSIKTLENDRKLNNKHLFKHILCFYVNKYSKRTFASQPAPKSALGQQVGKTQTTVLPNKLVVVSVEPAAPVSRVSIAFRAGARHETADNIGITHILRCSAGLKTKNFSSFGITRNLEQIGANLTTQTDREIIAYTLEGTKDNIEHGLKYLASVASPEQLFRPWELSDNTPRIKYELSGLPPQTKVLELLHRAAYRSKGLGNSIYCPKKLVSKHNSESLQHYVNTHLTVNRAAVTGIGVDHGELVAYAQNLQLGSGEGSSVAAKYFGGEVRKDKDFDLTHVAVAAEGASLKNEKEALAFAVLRKALGGGFSLKWGASASPLYKAVANAAGNEPVAAVALNVSYSDSGLFGVLVTATPKVAGEAVIAAVKQLRSASLSDADIARGKAQLKAEILFSGEDGSSVSEDITVQAALLGRASTPPELAAAVEALTSADVNAALKKVSQGKLSMAGYGRLENVPYLDGLP